MLYEQTLDLDTFQSFLQNQNTDHDPTRFYDEFFNLASSQEWKASNRLPGLPTPPATPSTGEKTRFPWNFGSNGNHSNNHVTSHIHTQNKMQQDNHASNRNNHFSNQNHALDDYQSQVVPDIIQEDHSEYTASAWYHEPPNSVSSVSSPIDIRKPMNVPLQHEVQYAASPYSSFTDLEDQLRSSSKNFTHTHLNLQSMEKPVSECVLSPSSPAKYKRWYYNSYCTDMAITEAGLRSSEENYFRQLAYEKARKRHVNIIEAPPAESELSKATHNVLERQRRNDLKLRFNILRDNIPEIVSNEKVAKIHILKKACECIEQLKAQEQKLLVDLELEKQRKLILLKRLKQLRCSYC